MTTLLADQLSGYAPRTGQTRFTFDGRTVIDITGYRPGGRGIRPLAQVPAALLRNGAAGPLGHAGSLVGPRAARTTAAAGPWDARPGP